ncbi:MAG TPA: glycoside hydrolase family 3 N-terminal domain-containing protein, partial [Ktedonobacteraceae bacterium]|nr:glycoside hydrolase family 3 N-terminal domain-containing protein [Ktedonobacteraceae bacterium]
GATNDPARARAAGLQDAKDLSSYGINLNLAPVVDVTNVFNSQLYMRTYGRDPALVTKMANAYLQGLQQSGKVIGTLKHFPGLGDVSSDPHQSVPLLTRSKSGLEQIDWAPYRTLIQQGNVHAIMVTHEIVTALDSTVPSSLSSKIVQGILRDELGFQGVIMTDSLTMEGVTDYYTPAQAAALAIEAGSDLLMGARSPSEVAAMIEGIKQAISSGAISQQHIDDSVRRILLMKYAMGLLPLPQH